MQNIPLSLSSSTIPSIRSLHPNPITRHLTQFSRPFPSFSSLSCRKASHPPSFLRLTAPSSPYFLISSPKNVNFKLAAASVPDAQSDDPTKRNALIRTLQLGAMFGIWYFLNIYFNIYNKQVILTSSSSSLFSFSDCELFSALIWFFSIRNTLNLLDSKHACFSWWEIFWFLILFFFFFLLFSIAMYRRFIRF